MQEALMGLGYRPTPRQQRMMTAYNNREHIEAQPVTLETVIEKVFAPITKHHKVVVRRAGSHYKARFDGQAASAFGETPDQASSKLHKLPMVNVRMKWDTETRCDGNKHTIICQ